VTTASFERDMSRTDKYQRWQFATLIDDGPVLRSSARSREADPEPEPEVPMVSESERARILEVARAEGYSAGFSTGRADAAHSVAAEVEHLKRLAEALSRARIELIEESADALLGLAVDIAQQVLRTELASSPESMLAAVREAIDLAGRGAHPQLMLNPGDVDIVRRHLGDELAANHWRIVEDARIEPGGCRALSADGSIDATLATRWQSVAATLGVEPPAERVADSGAPADATREDA
jgi:flagellar assembly protein FliH